METGSSEIEILAVPQGGEKRRADEVIREQEVVRIDREIHKFYCIPADLEVMMVGNLKSMGINSSFSKMRKIADNEYNVDLSFVKGLIESPQKCESSKILTSKEVFDSIEMLNANSLLFQKTGCTHIIGICGGREIFVEDISRHCAIDKAIGLALEDGIDLSNSFLVTSSSGWG